MPYSAWECGGGTDRKVSACFLHSSLRVEPLGVAAAAVAGCGLGAVFRGRVVRQFHRDKEAWE